MWPEKLQNMPTVKAVMSPFPYSVDLRDSLETAHEMMLGHNIHHLPVVEQSGPTGVISAQELRLAIERNPTRSPSDLLVADVVRQEAYVVDLTEPLDRVLVEMAERHLGAAVVVKEGRLAGIFTLTDACRCFAESLRRQFPSSTGDDAA